MLNRLTEAEARYLEIEEALANPDTASNQQEFAKAMKEYKSLMQLVISILGRVTFDIQPSPQALTQ